MCNDFVSTGRGASGVLGGPCPCKLLGHDEAVRRTWIALEEGGYNND